MASQKTLEHYLRQLRLIEEHREKWCEKNVRRHYRDLDKDLKEFLGVQYAELAENDQLTYEILHKKGQYARFIEEVEQRINKFTPQASQDIKNTVQLTYKKCFEGMVDAVEKSKDYKQLKVNLEGVRAVTPDVVKNVVKNSFLEDALEKNHKTVIYDIKQQIGIGLTQGDRMSTMAKRISEQIDSDYKKSVRIARTECHRVREAGFQDSSQRISEKLQESGSDYVMTKTWKTMQDMAVRPYRRKGKKGHKSFVMGSGPNHVKMQGVTVLVDEPFDLGDGYTAMTPGQSGIAGHDINCRCYVSRDLMTRAEFEKLTGRKIKSKSVEADTENKIEDVETTTPRWTDDDIDKASDRIKKRMTKDGQLTEAQRMEFDLEIVDNWSDEQVLVYDGFTKNKLTQNNYHYKKGGCYYPELDMVAMNIDDGYRNRCLGIMKTADWETKFHEEFHQIDQTLFGTAGSTAKITNGVRTKEFKNVFEQDVLELMSEISNKKIKNLNALTGDDEAMLELIKYMKDNYRTAKDKAQITMFTDALGLVTKNKFSPHDNGFWGHRKEYNESRAMSGAASETWATYGGISMAGYDESIEATKKLMPRTYELMEKWFREIVLPKCI